MMQTKKIFILFGAGILVGVMLAGFMRSMGVPAFETFLTYVFGEDNNWAIFFSISLIMVIMISTFNMMRKKDENNDL